MEITKHCYQRAKERYSLNKDSFERMVVKAIELGKKPTDFKGRIRKYLDKMTNEHNTVPVIFGEYLFFFAENYSKLVTTYQLPSKYKPYLSKRN